MKKHFLTALTIVAVLIMASSAYVAGRLDGLSHCIRSSLPDYDVKLHSAEFRTASRVVDAFRCGEQERMGSRKVLAG